MESFVDDKLICEGVMDTDIANVIVETESSKVSDETLA